MKNEKIVNLYIEQAIEEIYDPAKWSAIPEMDDILRWNLKTSQMHLNVLIRALELAVGDVG